MGITVPLIFLLGLQGLQTPSLPLTAFILDLQAFYPD
jgi:hypothetical protein